MWCMSIRYKARLWVILAIIGSFFLLQQSAFAWNWSQGVKDELIKRSGAEYVRGWVECGGPVADVEIGVYDETGRLLNLTFPLQDSPLYTGPSGVFAVAVQNLPDHFRIKAIGGFYGDNMFSQMEADIWYFDPEQDLVHINPVTTLLARYIDRYPDIDYEFAQTLVKQFLLIPEKIDLSYGPDIPAIYFNSEVFLEEAKKYGGIDPFFELLLNEMEVYPLDPRSFAMVGVDGGWGKWAGDKIVGGLVSGLTSKAFGYFLSEIGFPDDNKKILEGIKEIKKMLSQIMDMIAIVSSQLEDTRTQLSTEISQSNYDIRVSQAGLGELIRCFWY